MTHRGSIIFRTSAILLTATLCRAEIRVVIEHHDNDHATPAFAFEKVPSPSKNDAATRATFTLVSGKKDGNANNLDRLHDGKLPVWEDQPDRNFAFNSAEGGRIEVDLGHAIDIAQVNTYSWHPNTRGPQVYTLYAAEGTEKDFDSKPKKGVDPLACGWTRIAAIDTRPNKYEDFGGQYGVSISDSNGSIGRFRHLLFDISITEGKDPFGNTFYDEIDVIDRNGPHSESAVTEFSTIRHDPPGDPMDWTPPTSQPVLRERYDAAKYAGLSKKALAKIDINSLSAPGRPTGGVLIRSVKPVSPAEKLGIRTGDIVMSIDGVPLGSLGEIDDMKAVRSNEPQQMTFWSAKNGETTVTIPTGKIGVDLYPGWRPADSYARLSQWNPRWDDDMLTAAESFMSDPDLAETALSHAQDSGYQGPLLRPLAARIAFSQFRFDDVLAFDWRSWSRGNQLNRDAVRTYNTAALASFKLEQSLDLARRYPAILGPEEEVAATVAAYRAMLKSNLSDPITELSNVHHKRFNKFGAFEQQRVDDVGAAKWGASIWNNPQPMPLNVPSGHYTRMILTPGFANVALTVHFQLHNTDTVETRFARCLVVGLYDLAQAEPPGPLPDLIKVNLMTNGPITVSAFGLPQALVSLPQSVEAQTSIDGTIKLVILHNRCEVAFDDGRRIFYGPVVSDESKRRYGLFIQAVGVSGRVYPPIWERLDDSRGMPTTR